MPGRVRVQLTYTSRMIEKAFESVQAGSSKPLLEFMDTLGGQADDGVLQAYLVSAFMAVSRALLTETGDYTPPTVKIKSE